MVFHCSGVSGGYGSECGSAHYTQIGDAEEEEEEDYTKIGDAGVRRRLWTSLALLKWVAAHVER